MEEYIEFMRYLGKRNFLKNTSMYRYKRIVQEYLAQEATCPKCNGSNIVTRHSVHVHDDSKYSVCVCSDCKYEWLNYLKTK